MNRPWIVMLCCWVSSICLAKTSVLQQVRMASQANTVRMVFELSSPAVKVLKKLDKPTHLILQFDQTRLDATGMSLDLDTHLLNALTARQKNHNLQLQFQFERPVQPHIFTLKATATHPYRVVVDLAQLAHVANPAPKVAALSGPIFDKPQQTFKPKPKFYTVVIDAGHGGKDSGAVGAFRLQEKRVVLAIARQLQKDINAMPHLRAVMTRKGDYYVGLRQRLYKARAANADIFVAVHADAFHNPRSAGASVYALSQRGATSEAARWLADKENSSELGTIPFKSKDKTLQSVLLDMSQTATIAASLTLGDNVLTALSHFAGLHHDRVERAPFVVLKSPDIPSILVETGFISNPNEARKLSQVSYQKRLAKAIAEGVAKYFDVANGRS